MMGASKTRIGRRWGRGWSSIRSPKLRPWEQNPRRISERRLEELGRALEADREMLWVRPLIANADRVVFCGNQRLRAAMQRGWEKVPTVFVEIDDERLQVVGAARQQHVGRVGRTGACRTTGRAGRWWCRSRVDRVRRSRPRPDPCRAGAAGRPGRRAAASGRRAGLATRRDLSARRPPARSAEMRAIRSWSPACSAMRAPRCC